MATTEHPNHTRDEQPPVDRCGAVRKHLRLLRSDPDYRWRRTQIEREVEAWTARYSGAGLRSGIIRIPVVVHVVHNTAAENISDAQIHSQIAVLNEDFRRLNADAVGTPGAFAGVAADARLEFALAVRGPGCLPTDGITRTSTNRTSWIDDDTMKAAATGGADPWDQAQYINIWVVNFSGGLLGYGTFPGMPAQGVVVDYRAFGTTGTLTPGAHLGRTLTHELGHFFDLHHIWGDDPGGVCSDGDLVADTPNQAANSPFNPASCRTFPSISCSNGPNGDMFMNYMDYSADHCMNMFTAGQVARMDAAIHTQRTGLLASPGLVPAVGVPGPDLWSKDVSDDFGEEPDTSSQPMYLSDDIWVRRSNDGLSNQDHQNPEYGQTNWVYVRVRNRACAGSQSGTVRLYWAKASSGLSWPSPWDGSVTSPALMGAPLGSSPVTVAAGDDEIVSFAWTPPNPADYVSFGADQHHFCLLSRIETAATAPFGMTVAETSNLYANVQNNNNIVWKNISVVDETSARMSGFTLANFGDQPQDLRLVLTVADEAVNVLHWGRVLVDMPAELAERLRQREGIGIEWLSPTMFEVREAQATVGGDLELAPGELHALNVRLVPKGKQLGARILTLDAQQFDGRELVGGVRFVVRTKVADVGRPSCKDHGPRDGHNWFGAAAGEHGCCC